MMMKPMCSGSAASSATSSRRSPGDRPAAGSSNRISRGAPASAMPISSWRCWPCDRLDTRRCATDCRRTRSSSSSVASARGVRRARPAEVEAAARDAAHGEEEIVPDREVAEQQRRLVGAPQSHADAVVGRHLGDVLAEEAHAARGRREVAGDDVEQRRLAGAIGPDHRPPLARRHRERDVLDGAQRAECPRDALELEGVAGGERRCGSSEVIRVMASCSSGPPASGRHHDHEPARAGGPET